MEAYVIGYNINIELKILCNIFLSIGPMTFSLWNDQTPSKGGAHNQNLPWKNPLVAFNDDIPSNSCSFSIDRQSISHSFSCSFHRHQGHFLVSQAFGCNDHSKTNCFSSSPLILGLREWVWALWNCIDISFHLVPYPTTRGERMDLIFKWHGLMFYVYVQDDVFYHRMLQKNMLRWL